MRLVACQVCHAQFDVTNVEAKEFQCRCGATVPNQAQRSVDAPIRRCSACGALLEAGKEQCEYCGSAIVRDRQRLSLICPECYACNAEQASYCASCGVAFRPEPLPEEGQELPCPSCKSPLVPRRVGGVGLEECPKCNGLWVPGKSFDALVKRAVESTRERASLGLGAVGIRPKRSSPVPQRVVYRRCPVCNSPMHRKNFGRRSGVVVDWCRADGTWLDADELEQIAEFIVRGGLAKAMTQPGYWGSAGPSTAGRSAHGGAGRDGGSRGALPAEIQDPGQGLSRLASSLGDLLEALLGL